jgi:flagellar motor switch/type III secretory pathway protein FliN
VEETTASSEPPEASAEPVSELLPEAPPEKKVELKKTAPLVPSVPPVDSVSSSQEEGGSSVSEPLISLHSKKISEPPPHSPSQEELEPAAAVQATAPQPNQKLTPSPPLPVGVAVEIDFSLGSQHILLTELATLAEGELITLSGRDFKVTVRLQEKAIAEAQLVMVDQQPSLQITKILKIL